MLEKCYVLCVTEERAKKFFGGEISVLLTWIPVVAKLPLKVYIITNRNTMKVIGCATLTNQFVMRCDLIWNSGSHLKMRKEQFDAYFHQREVGVQMVFTERKIFDKNYQTNVLAPLASYNRINVQTLWINDFQKLVINKCERHSEIVQI